MSWSSSSFSPLGFPQFELFNTQTVGLGLSCLVSAFSRLLHNLGSNFLLPEKLVPLSFLVYSLSTCLSSSAASYDLWVPTAYPLAALAHWSHTHPTLLASLASTRGDHSSAGVDHHAHQLLQVDSHLFSHSSLRFTALQCRERQGYYPGTTCTLEKKPRSVPVPLSTLSHRWGWLITCTSQYLCCSLPWGKVST